ncbi:hypothetical protein PHMEG_00012897 [Phytophthora megakarya]|uniref:Uncharacterized protein n=1 Tax=Phytophthora megakarya TaxID=4795 RepID=A0A225W7J9_9STRA|nr:hypothetical protein PHMEG_00012897 [Phytophthora megakarya]
MDTGPATNIYVAIKRRGAKQSIERGLGCVWCRDSGRREPNEDEGRQMLEDYPTAEDEEHAVDQYRNAEGQARHGGRSRHPEGLPPLKPPPRMPQRNLELRWDWTVAGNATATRTRVLEDGTMIIVPPRSTRQCGEYGQHDRQGVPDYRAGNAAQGWWVEAEAARGRQCAAERLTRLEREMADLRRELDVVQEPPREERDVKTGGRQHRGSIRYVRSDNGVITSEATGVEGRMESQNSR